MTATIENLFTNKRKFISDDEVYPPSARILSIANQVESSCNTKKIKSITIERLPSSTIDIDDTDDMMICEDSNLKENGTHKTDETADKSQVALLSEHCNDKYNTDPHPTIFLRRCYCDPYQSNGLIPYHSHLF